MKKYGFLLRIISILLCVFAVLSFITTAVSAVGLEDIYRIGDVNLDGEINVKDVTAIQKHLAKIELLNEEMLSKADADYNLKISIRDASHLQLILSKIYVPLTAKKGVDISKHNGDVDMKKIKKAGYDFVMIRCGFGNNDTSQDDSRFEANVKKCEEAGMPWGVYLYSYALNTDDAKSEVKHTLRLLKGKKPTLPIAFDMEDADGYKKNNGMPSNAALVKICKTYLKGIKDAGYYPILYASLSWFKNQLNNEELLNTYDVWLAQWNTECTFKGKNLGIWQYGGETNYIESNSISGVGVIDKNFCYKDYPLLIKNQGYNGWG